jgi:hypothetical protein
VTQEYEADPALLLHTFSGFWFTVAVRFHAHVLSVCTRTPLISLSMTNKTEYTTNDSGLTAYTVSSKRETGRPTRSISIRGPSPTVSLASRRTMVPSTTSTRPFWSTVWTSTSVTGASTPSHPTTCTRTARTTSSGRSRTRYLASRAGTRVSLTTPTPTPQNSAGARPPANSTA